MSFMFIRSDDFLYLFRHLYELNVINYTYTYLYACINVYNFEFINQFKDK